MRCRSAEGRVLDEVRSPTSGVGTVGRETPTGDDRRRSPARTTNSYHVVTHGESVGDANGEDATASAGGDVLVFRTATRT